MELMYSTIVILAGIVFCLGILLLYSQQENNKLKEENTRLAASTIEEVYTVSFKS